MSAQTLAPGERDIFKIVQTIRQLVEGRSNAVGSVTLAHDGAATSTTVSAVNCAAGSSPWLTPQTAHASGALLTTYIKAADVIQAQFTITHAPTSSNDLSYYYGTIG